MNAMSLRQITNNSSTWLHWKFKKNKHKNKKTEDLSSDMKSTKCAVHTVYWGLAFVVLIHIHVSSFLRSALGSSELKRLHCLHFLSCFEMFWLEAFKFFFNSEIVLLLGIKRAFDMTTFCLIYSNLFKLCAHIYTVVIISVRFMKPVM